MIKLNHMNKTTLFTSILSTTILFISSLTSCDGIIERNNEPLDAAYANFEEINEKYHSDIFEVKLFCETEVTRSSSPNPIRIFPSVNDQLIVSCDAEKNDETQGDMLYYKVNSKGITEDTLHLSQNKYWPEFIDDFIIFTNDEKAYYTTWPQDGDTTTRAFKVLNEDLSWSGEKINQKIASAKKDGKYWFLKNVTRNDHYYMQFFFYQDEQWQMLWQEIPAYRSIDSSEDAGRYRDDVFWTGEQDPYLPENVTFLHFHPEEKLKYSHNIGGGSPGYSVKNWRGKAFFKTKIGDRNFNFFEPHIAVEKERFDDYKNRFYTVLEANYSALHFRPTFYISPHGFAFYSSNSQSMYLIRKK